MKRLLPFLILFSTVFTTALSAQKAKDLYGVWNWPVPVFEDGTTNFTEENHTIVFKRVANKNIYTLYDQSRKRYETGKFKVSRGVLTLKRTQYSIELKDFLGDGGYYELCLKSKGSAPYFSMSSKEGQFLSESVESFDEGDYIEVIGIVNFAGKLGIRDPALMIEKAKALIELNRKEEAEEALKQILQIKPEDPDARGYLERLNG